MNDAKPPIVSIEEWNVARDALLLEEKQATRALDAIAAKRRRLPMVHFGNDYQFDTPNGPKSLLDFFGDNKQLVAYQFMDVGPDNFCGGCTWFTNNVADLASLVANGASWITISDMPLSQFEGYATTKNWSVPIASSHGTTFRSDCGSEGGFLLTVFYRDGDDIYRTYSTTSRGVDRLLFVNNILDLLPYGRQEDWEDSPEGWPQLPTYG